MTEREEYKETQLDLNLLNDIKSLSCVYHSSKEVPILMGGARFADRKTMYVQDVIKGETPQAFLNRLYQNSEPYPMDNHVFVQLACNYLTGQWPKDEAFKLVFSRVVDDHFWKIKQPFIGCITVHNKEIRKVLSKCECLSEFWCIKVGDDEYLGLSAKGPMVLCLEDWSKKYLITF